jgi:hypothetical protein
MRLSPLFRSNSDKAIQRNNHLQTSNLGSMYEVLWCNLNLICIAMKHPVHRRHLKLLASTWTFKTVFISDVISFQLNTVTKSPTASFIVFLKLKYCNRMCSSYCEQNNNIRVLWNELALNRSSVLCLFVSIVRYPAWGSEMSRSISGHNMNTSIRLHIRSTSGVSRDNHRTQQFLQCREATCRR